MRIFKSGRQIVVGEDDTEMAGWVELMGSEMMPSEPCVVTTKKGGVLVCKDSLFRYGLMYSNPPWPKPKLVLGPEKKTKRCKDTVDFGGTS